MDDMSKFGLASAFGGLGAGLGSLMMGGQDNPYDSASGYYNQIPGMLKGYFNPYIQQGQRAGGQLEGQFGQLVNDPNAVMGRIGGGYQQSPGFQWQLGQGMSAANNAAAAGGMQGTPQHQQQAATMATGLANQDYYNYLNHALGLYGTGLSGLQGMNQMGYDATNQLGGGLASALMNQGNLAYSGQAAQNQAQGQMWGNLAGAGGALAAFGGLF